VIKFIHSLLLLLLHMGYGGPVLLGILDSSFLFLPFGNDLLVVILVSHHPAGLPWYVLAAATGSTIGVLLLAFVARKLGEEGVKRMAGPRRFEKLSGRIQKHGGKAVVLACIAPPPFPFTMVIAAAAALDYSRLRIGVLNFIARGVRFTILGLIAIRYGSHILKLAHAPAYRWGMFAFILLCVAGSVLSVYAWLKNVRPGRPA
jgi:membrane protein YqaA with SNARE-associated domain